MTIRLAAPLSTDSIVDGEGLRTVLWTQGCLLNCPGCHNPQTHALTGGIKTDVELVKIRLRQTLHQRGLTFSGGEPFLQVLPCAEIARFAKKTLGWDIWCYSGYTLEQLQANPQYAPLLKEIDTLIDGPFLQTQRDPTLRFRGSKNQRILHLRQGEII
jgi:anaerobic ribonucleoside-triphosphate reductase activating protein